MFISTIVLGLMIALTLREWIRFSRPNRSEQQPMSLVIVAALTVVGALFWFFTFKSHDF